MYLPKNKIRLLSLVSLVFLAQCCCIVIPFQGQVQQEFPAAAQAVETVSQVFSGLLSQGRIVLGQTVFDLSFVSAWFNDLQHLVTK